MQHKCPVDIYYYLVDVCRVVADAVSVDELLPVVAHGFKCLEPAFVTQVDQHELKDVGFYQIELEISLVES